MKNIEDRSKKKSELTIEKLRKDPVYSHLSDEEAEDVICQLRMLARVIIHFFIDEHTKSV